MYAKLYVGIDTICLQILTHIGHRFGHLSALYESCSGQDSAAILNVFEFRVYVVFSKVGNILKNVYKYKFPPKIICLVEGMSLNKQKNTCGKHAQP